MLLSTALANERVEKLDCAWVFTLALVKVVKKRKALRWAVHTSVFPLHLAAAVMRDKMCAHKHIQEPWKRQHFLLCPLLARPAALCYTASHPTQPDKLTDGYKAKQAYVMYRVCTVPKGVT